MMEFDEIVVKESPGLCRCCLSEGCYKDLGTEYTWMNETEVYADMLLECFDISITQHNDGPNGPNRLICEVCITRLRDACNFKKQVLDSEKKFIDMMGRGEFRPKMLIYQTQMKCEDTVEAPIEEADVEYLEDDIDFADVSEELIKDETEPSVSDVTVATLPVKGKRGRPRKNAVKPEKRPKVDDKAKTSKAVAKDGLSRRQEGCTYERLRKNLEILFNHTTIIPFKWRGKYICFYCGTNFTGIIEFRNHTKSHGLCSTEDDSLKRIKGTNVEIKLDVSEINCEICRVPFETFGEIIDHLIGKHNMEYDKSIDTPFQVYRLVDGKCLHCEKHFSYFGYLVQHVNSVHPQNCFTCNDCGLTCNKKRDLAVHIRNYHRPKGYPCALCSKDFKNNHALQRHLNSAHFMQCMSCGLRLASLALLQKHTIAEHPQNEDSRKCGYCSKEFNTSQGLRQHLSQCKVKLIPTQQPEEPVDEKAYAEPKKKQNIYQIRQNIQCVLNMSTAVPFKFFSQYSCFYCSKKFVEFDELRQHTTAEHPVCDSQCKGLRACIGKRSTIKIDISELVCKVCGLPMPNLEDLVNHLIEEHEAKYDTSITGCLDPYRLIKDNIPCPKCPDAVFRYFRNLLRHINSVHSNNNTICDFCGQRFNDVMNLKVHIKNSHTGSCECDVCGLKFKNRLKLARHRATVHNVKNHKCPQCPEMFVSDYQMQRHLLKIHKIGHKCSYCGQMFTNDSSMVKHVRRLHFNEKNFECTVCCNKFFDVQRLKVHMVKHVGEMKFHCDICGKMFGWKKNLRRHVATHKQ